MPTTACKWTNCSHGSRWGPGQTYTLSSRRPGSWHRGHALQKQSRPSQLLYLSPLLNKLRYYAVWRWEQLQATRRVRNSWRQETRKNSKPFFFFFSLSPSRVQKKRNQKRIFTQLSTQELHSTRQEWTRKFHYSQKKIYLRFLLKRQPMSKWEKDVFKR